MRATGFLGFVVALGGLAVCASSAEAQSASEPAAGVQLTIPVRETLARLQDQWLLWNSAFLQRDRDHAERAVEDLRAIAGELGMERLPDLSFGILARAVESAREEDYERARWSLAMAELLDPGRPEAAFARSRIASLDGAYHEAVWAHFTGYARLLGQPEEGLLLLHNLALWVLGVLMVSGGLFVALQMAIRGGCLYRSLAEFLARFLPGFAAYILAVLVLTWPLLLPGRWIWLTLYWGALLWSSGSRSERLVIAGICVVSGLAPLIVLQQQRDLEASLSEPVRALRGLASGRLYGSLFQDVEALQERLPESPAVTHLIADLHTTLGQDEQARPLYLSLLEEEPDNAAVLINLGTYHYHRREYIKAIERYREATDAEPDALAANYNLSQAYRALLEFKNADQYLEQARAIDVNQVNEWIAGSTTAVSLRQGFARDDEIRRQLPRHRGEGDDGSFMASLLDHARSAPVAFVALALAVVLQVLRKGSRQPPAERTETVTDRLARRLIPGLGSVQEGAGVRAFTAVLIPVAALFLPLAGVLGYRIPWGYDPGNAVPWAIAGIVLVSYSLVRWRWQAG